MAIKATVTTKFGEEKELYFRINHNPIVAFDGVSKIDVLLRGYVDSFENGKLYMWSSDESDVDLTFDQSDIDLNGNIREQLYALLMSDDRVTSVLSNISAC